MPPIATQNRWSLRKEIFTYLSNQIECGALTPGSLINVRKLTEELNVSRTPLREALAQLEIQGLVSILPQRGVRAGPRSFRRHLRHPEREPSDRRPGPRRGPHDAP